MVDRRKFIELLGGGLSLTALIGITSGQDIDPVEYIAHRGFADRYPENTLRAIKNAASDGADTIEFDVRPCADGTLVVFHDNSLDHKTDAEGLVAETPSETVLSTTVLDSDSTIPRFADAIAAVPPSVSAIVELKSPGNEQWPAIARRVLETINNTPERDGSATTYISSFHEPALAAVSEIEPGRPLQVLPGGDVQGGLEIAEKYDVAAVSVRKADATPSLAAKLHKQDRILVAYTVRSRKRVHELRKIGVDGVTCDSPQVLPKNIKILSNNTSATDPDGDGQYEDVDGDGDVDVVDVQALFANRDSDAVQDNPHQFDFNRDERVDVVDVQRLFANNT